MLIDIKLRKGPIIGFHDVIKVEQTYDGIKIVCTQVDAPNFTTFEKEEDIECLVLTMDKIPQIDCPYYTESTDTQQGCDGGFCDYCRHEYEQKPRPVLECVQKALRTRPLPP